MAEHPSFQTLRLPPGEPIAGKTYRADGWAYVGPRICFSPDIWDHLLGIIGAENYAVLALAKGNHPAGGEPYVRGQLLVSPAGLVSLQSFLRLRKN